MRKNLRLLLTALLCAVMGQAMAQQVTLDFTSNDVWKFPEGSSNKATEAKAFSNGTYTITLTGSEGEGYYYNTSGYLIIGKTGAAVTLPAFNFKVAAIEVVGRTGASGNVTENIFVGDESVSTEVKGATGTNRFEIASAYQAAGNIYTLKITNNYNAQITAIKIYKVGEVAKLTPTMSFSSSSITVIVGEDVTAPVLTYDGDGTVTYSSDNEDVATVDASTGEVDVIAAGTANITASAPETQNYFEASASYKITAANPQGTHEVVDGTFDFTDKTDYGSGLEPSAEDEYITEPYTWKAGNITLVVEGKYRWWFAATGNTLRIYSNIVDEVQTSKMTISAPAGMSITQIDLSGSGLVFKADVGEFSSGKWTGEAQKVVLTYDGTGTKQIKTITVTYTGGTTPVEKQKPTMKFSTNYITIIKGDPFTAPELNYDGDGTVTYASDNVEVATVNATTGAVTIIGAGQAKITATATETDNYEAAEASYTISVIEPQGTHDVVDGTFDFTDNTAYGSGLKPSAADEYLSEPSTWTAGNVTLVAEGKYRWWLNGNGNTLRLYTTIGKDDPEGTPQGSKITISVPSGYTINKIEFNGSGINFTANTGEFASSAWTGSAQSVVLTYSGSGTIQIKTITVDYGKNRIDPQLAWSAETASATLGSSFTAPTLSKNQNYNGVINYSSRNESVATISAAGAVTIVGAGTTIITATAPSSDTNIESTASYTLTVTDPNASDVTYDFTTTNDYGTGLEPSSDSSADSYIYDDKTWINNPVSLVTSGKYRYWLNAKGNTLRLYSNVVEEQETTKLTFSVPNDKTITAIEFNTGENDAFTTTVGTFSEKAWAGDAKEVVLTLAKDKKPYISTIKVTYKDASTTGLPGDADEDGSVSLADIMLVVDAILTDDTSHLNLTNADIDKSGGLSLSDIMGIVAIILAQ